MYVHVPPGEIETRSLAIIDAEVPEPRPFAGGEWALARRMVHTTADFDLLNHIRFHPGAVDAGIAALLAGADIVTDTRMALSGIPVRRLDPLGCRVRCLMDDDRVAARAVAEGVTRAWAAVDEVMDGGGADIFVIGNAPTALFRLLDRIGQLPNGLRPNDHRPNDHRPNGRRPQLIVGMPVGFVNAAESKELLMAQDAVPYITVAGRKGGSSLAACVVNALLILARGDGRP